VNVILATIAWVISASPVDGPSPGTRLKTPGGKPTSSRSSVIRMTASDAYSDGFMTTVQPVARAGAAFWANRKTGAFQGMIAATTPTGSRSVYEKYSAPVKCGIVSPVSLSIQPVW